MLSDDLSGSSPVRATASPDLTSVATITTCGMARDRGDGGAEDQVADIATRAPQSPVQHLQDLGGFNVIGIVRVHDLLHHHNGRLTSHHHRRHPFKRRGA